MNRRNFLASLFGIPTAMKLKGDTKISMNRAQGREIYTTIKGEDLLMVWRRNEKRQRLGL